MTHVVVIFPFGGLRSGKAIARFWEIVDLALEQDRRVLVVINKDTQPQHVGPYWDGINQAPLASPRRGRLTSIQVWSVDTCQMWLAGWGLILDQHPNVERIVLLPGDIQEVADPPAFYNALRALLVLQSPAFVIGDFKTTDRFSSKELIDTYGTYALLTNWFPVVAAAVQQLGLLRPRSEFLSVDAGELRRLLGFRKFAYEQTLNMLIRSWDHGQQSWSPTAPLVVGLGVVEDDRSFRDYRGALDQIERTERMLRLLWREQREQILHDGGATEDDYREFHNEYDRLDRRSTGIREGARVTIKGLLKA